MAKMTLPLVNLEGTVLNEVYYDVARDVAKTLKLQEGIDLVLYNSSDTATTDLRYNTHFKDRINTPKTVGSKRLEIRVTTDFDTELFDTETINRRGNYPFFKDSEIGVFASTIYLHKKLEFEFTYTSTKSDVERIRNHIRMFLGREHNCISHDIQYTMVLPSEFETFIEDVHALKSRLFPSDVFDYLKLNATRSLHSFTDMNNAGNALLAIREQQTEKLGYFEMTDEPPTASTDNTANMHSIEFTYRLDMEVPKGINLEFPVMICNRKMPDNYLIPLQKWADRDLALYLNTDVHIGRNNNWASRFQTKNTHRNRTRFPYPINIPGFDHYKPVGEFTSAYGRIITVLTAVNEDDKRSLFNLKDLDPWTFSRGALKYIRENRRRVCRMHQSFIYFGLMQEGTHFNNEVLEIDEDLNVRSTVDLDITKITRVVLSGLTDMTYLPEEVKEEIITDDDLFEMFLREYLEMTEQLTRRSNVSGQDRNNVLYATITRKLSLLFRDRKYEALRRLIYLISTHYALSVRLAQYLARAYPKLCVDMEEKDIAVITEVGGIEIPSSDPFEREDQGSIGDILQKEFPGQSMEEISKGGSNYRDFVRLGVPRTQMTTSVIVYKKER